MGTPVSTIRKVIVPDSAGNVGSDSIGAYALYEMESAACSPVLRQCGKRLIQGSASIKQGLNARANQGSTQKRGQHAFLGVSKTGSGVSAYVNGVERFQSGLGEYQDKGSSLRMVSPSLTRARKIDGETKDLREIYDGHSEKLMALKRRI